MGILRIILQNAYIAWGITIVSIVVMVFAYHNTRKKYDKALQSIREKASAEIQNANNQANKLVRQAQTQRDTELQLAHEATVQAVRHEHELCAEKIRLLQEQISADKSSIMQKTEKEILADLTVSMSGFAKRIERVESKLTPIEQQMELIVDKVDSIGVTVSDAQFHL